MIPLQEFKEYLSRRIIEKRNPNFPRSKALISEAEKRKLFLEDIFEKVGLSDKNANYFIENVYDTLIGLLRAKLLHDGYKTTGAAGAHEAEVAYMRNLGFAEHDVRFMNELRHYRNGILYYGKSFDAEYGLKVLEFMKKVYPKLKNL
jgi:hypothetical protein